MNKRGAARDSRAGMSSSTVRFGDTRGVPPEAQPLAPATGFNRSVRLYTATALAGGLLSVFALAAPAAAQQGGAGGSGGFETGGAGGDPGQPGGPSSYSPYQPTPGGAAGATPGAHGGDGGRGGATGPDFAQPSSPTANGGDGGDGVGIRGSDLSIVNAGSISGGLGGDGMSRAFAVHLTGGANSLELQSGASVTGGIRIDAGDLTFVVSSGAETLASAATCLPTNAEHGG